MLVTMIVASIAYRRFLQSRFVLGEVLVVSGSFSNLIDRVLHYGVIDFIQILYGDWSWPLFNIADCCIVVGVIIMFIQYSDHQ